jgi:hypothetical protein
VHPDDDPLDRSVRKLNAASIGGALVALPVVPLAAFGAPLGLTLAYLVVVIAVLGTIAVRRHRAR